MRKDGIAVVPPCLSPTQAGDHSARDNGRIPDRFRQHLLRSALCLAGDLRNGIPVRGLHQVPRSLIRSRSYSSRSQAEYS